MTDEFERIRRSLSVPAEDAEAEARALARLELSIEVEKAGRRRSFTELAVRRSRLRRRIVVVGVAAASALIVIAIQSLLPSQKGGPPVSAASELQRLADVASLSPAVDLADGYLYTEVDEASYLANTDLSGGGTWFVHVRDRVETWIAADGSGRRVRTIEDVSFPTTQDRETWVGAGRPNLPSIGVSVERYGPGGLLTNDTSSLPTDPAALREAIHSGTFIEVPPGPLGTISGADFLLSESGVPPEVREGLFQLMATTTGITLGASVVDPLGRSGESFSYQEGTSEETLIIDPTSARVLARTSVDEFGYPSTYSYVRSGVVPATNDTP